MADRKVQELRRTEKAAAQRLAAPRDPARSVVVPVSTKPRPRGSRPFAEQVFEAHLRQLARLVKSESQLGVRRLYETAIADLRKRLANAPADPTRATPVEIQALIAQAEAVLGRLGQDLNRHLADVGRTASEMGAQHGVDEYRRISTHFTGSTPVLQVEKGAQFSGMLRDVDASLLRRYERVSQTWSLGAISEMERQLAVGAMTGKSWHEITSEIAGTQGLLEAERWKAERIVRTELQYAHGSAKFQAMRRIRDDVGEARLWKKLIATFDDRTGDDSFLVHGQAVPLEQPFEWKHRIRGAWVVSPYQHPPNRPNDREVVIPWDPSWDAQKGFEAPLTRSELLAARPTRWRKTIGVKIPPGHKPGQPYSYKVKVPSPEEAPPEATPAPASPAPAKPTPRTPRKAKAPKAVQARPAAGAFVEHPDVKAWAPAAYQEARNQGSAPTGVWDRRGMMARLKVSPNGEDTFSVDEQKEIRKDFREILARYGLVSTDLVDSSRQYGAGVFRNNVTTAEKGLGFHGWNGNVAMGPTMSEGLRDFGAGKRDTQAQAAMKCTIHEEVHGHGGVRAVAYQGVGRWVEEGTTEICARKIFREQFGSSVEQVTISNPGSRYTPKGWSRPTGIGTYQDVLDVIQMAIGRSMRTAGTPITAKEGHPLMERAAFRFRASTAVSAPATPDAALDAFVEAIATDDTLKSLGKDFRADLRQELNTLLGSLR